MTTVQGNILDVVKQGVICHQVNCQRVAGAGLALQIREKWPGWYKNFQATEPQMGKTTYFEVEPGLYIANLYAQHGYGNDGKTYTNYTAFEACLQSLKATTMPLYFPHGIGCGLAGGTWAEIIAILTYEIPRFSLVKLPELEETAQAENDGWVLIHTYTRAQALDDGLLLDVTEMAVEAGFNVPVAITASVQVIVTPSEYEKEMGQSYEGRLWDVLYMASYKARQTSSDTFKYKVIVAYYATPNGSKETTPRKATTHTLIAKIGPGDNGEAVITIGFPRDF